MRRLLLFIALLAVCLHAGTAAALTIRGDRHWVENPDCPDGWRLLDFDDSSWSRVPYPWTRMWPRSWPLDPDARPIWGTQVVHVNCLRRTFELDSLPAEPAVANIWVDDDYELFINGIPVGSSSDHAGEMPGETYDITPLLRLGKNVIAVRASDNGGSMAVLLSAAIPDVPDPAPSLRDRLAAIQPWLAFVLATAAIAAWAGLARRLTQTPGTASAPHATVAATLLLTAACQTLFAAASFYESHREMPLAIWHWLPLLAAAVLLLGLAVVRSRSGSDSSEKSAVPREALWLTAIVVLAIVLRTYALDSMPPGFFQDEATNGNDAVAILAYDSLAIWSDSVGGRPTLFLYLLGFVLQHVGVSYLSLKIVPVVLGVAGIVAVYAVGRLALGPRIALWAAFFLAVSRWDIHYSRMAWEAICVPLFSAAGFALLLAGLRGGKRAPLCLILAALVLTVGIYTYAAYRAVPAAAGAFLFATLLSGDRKMLFPRWLSLTIAGFVAAAIAAPLLRFGWEQPELYWYRYSEVSLTRYMEYYATPLPWLHQFGKGLLSLTSVGDEIIRHNLPWAPHLDRITGGLMLIGMTTALAVRGDVGIRLLWCWFLAFMVLATLTMDGPHATRLLGVVPAAVLFAGFGMTRLLGEIGRAWGRHVASASAVVAAIAITGLNAYEYFVLEANHPAADLEYDATGRSLCEQVRLQKTLVDLRWSDDLAYWASGQCEFLARGRYMLGAPLRLPDVLPGNPYESGASRPTLIAIGPEFIDIHRQSLPFDEHGVPKFSLPGEPLIGRDRAGHILYYLFRIALPPPLEAG